MNARIYGGRFDGKGIEVDDSAPDAIRYPDENGSLYFESGKTKDKEIRYVLDGVVPPPEKTPA